MKYSGLAAAVWLLASSAYAQEASAPQPSINQPRDWRKPCGTTPKPSTPH